MPDTDSVMYGRIAHVERLSNSRNGNARFILTILDEFGEIDVWPTSSDSAAGMDVQNFARADSGPCMTDLLRFTLKTPGWIRAIEKV